MDAKSDFETLLTKILQQACELLVADGASIFLREGDYLTLKATTGNRGTPDTSPMRYHLGEGLTGQVAQTRHSVKYDQPAAEWKPKYDELEGTTSQVKSMVAAPIMLNEEAIGVIRLVNTSGAERDTFSQDDLRTIEVFARTAAAAIDAQRELSLATSAPYVFVLMPFSEGFRDAYELGIRAVTQSLGMRCERVDEIEFNDTILAQIYKGIQRADVIVADMTGRNPNVFYEVGYAHALHKDVILLTQNVGDIPFDLKGHNHIVYHGQVTTLRDRLQRRLENWLGARETLFKQRKT